MDSDTSATSLGISIGAAVLALIGVLSVCVKRLKHCRSGCCDGDFANTPPATRQPSIIEPRESDALIIAAVEAVARSRALSSVAILADTSETPPAVR
jgi:hypothetical protein